MASPALILALSDKGGRGDKDKKKSGGEEYTAGEADEAAAQRLLDAIAKGDSKAFLRAWKLMPCPAEMAMSEESERE